MTLRRNHPQLLHESKDVMLCPPLNDFPSLNPVDDNASHL